MDVASSQAQHNAAGGPLGYASSGNGAHGAPIPSIAVGSQSFTPLLTPSE